jgi:hypothetical protein
MSTVSALVKSTSCPLYNRGFAVAAGDYFSGVSAGGKGGFVGSVFHKKMLW